MNFFLTAGLAEAVEKGIMGLLLAIDGIFYWIVSVLFELYEQLATFKFLTDDTYELIANRIFVVIGVVMLFYLAYALLKALVNPDELNKITSKIVSNIVISLVLINIVPYIFNYAYEIQNILLGQDNVIGKLILGNANSNIASEGKATAMTFLEAFLRPGDDIELEVGDDVYKNWNSLKICIINNKTEGCKGNEGFRNIASLAGSVVSGDTEYIFLISTACGGFLIYIIASFCLDLGVRVVKLAFYQIIAPIPIVMRIIPEKKSVFDNWVKATSATYLEVFIRLAIMYITVFFASLIPDIIASGFDGELGIIGTVIVLMGVFAFAKQAPKLIGDVIGVDGGNIKLGIRDKLATGGAFMAGAAIGGGVTAGVRNFTHGMNGAWSGVSKTNDWRTNAKGIGKGILKTGGSLFSAAGGAASGLGRGAKSGISAKNEKDMKLQPEKPLLK